MEVSISQEHVKEELAKVTFSENDTKIPRKEKLHQNKVKFYKKEGFSRSKSRNLCRILKGGDNPTWEIHNTEHTFQIGKT